MNDPSRHVRALVVGAGPTGLTAAVELARLGVPFTLIDRLDEPHRQTRATAVLPWSLELLEASGATALLVDEAVHSTGTDVYDDRGRWLSGHHFDDVPSTYDWLASLPQWRTEAILTERLRELGGEIERSVTLVAIDERDDGVDVTVQVRRGTEGERTEVWRADWVVCATGSEPTVRHSLHEQLEGGDYARRHLVADVVVEIDVPFNRTAIFVGEGGIAGVVGLPEGRRLVVIDDGDDGPDAPSLDEVREHLEPRIHVPWRARDLRWSSCFTLHHRIVPRLATERVFLAGDTAHMSSLFGAFGMNGGIQDAANLAWKLAFVHRDEAGQELLDTYELERWPENQRRVAAADAMHRGLARQAGRREAGDATYVLPTDPAAANELRSTLDVRYPSGPAVAEGGPAFMEPGTRFADPELASRERFTLLAGEDVALPERLVSRWSHVIAHAGPMAIDLPCAVLVRPDGIVGWSTGDVDDTAWSALDAHLTRLFTPRG